MLLRAVQDGIYFSSKYGLSKKTFIIYFKSIYECEERTPSKGSFEMQQQHWLRQRRNERVCPLQTKKRHCSRRQMRCPYLYSYVTSNIFFAATLAFALTHTTAQGRHASPHGLADTPPQGWTSWNTAGCRHLSQTFIETIMVCAVKHQCPPSPPPHPLSHLHVHPTLYKSLGADLRSVFCDATTTLQQTTVTRSSLPYM